MSGRSGLIVVVGVAAWLPPCLGQSDCYGGGDVAGIVIATLVVTAVVAGLAFAAVWFVRKRQRAAQAELDDTAAITEKKAIGIESKYAFDNPYFKDEDIDPPTIDSAEKGMAGPPADNGTVAPFPPTVKPANPVSNKSKKLLKPTMTLPFASVFTAGRKQRAMDDSCLAVEPERVMVPLRGHDFTGLGFNICGNMRDGIFVKDVLHRGPASESGKIRAGDRILNVTVSFANMVYEDALTILSYASPYDVQLELEKATEKSHGIPTASPGKRLGSASFTSGRQRLFHPLYRSQSIDDLTQIGREVFTPNDLAPKRSQSVGLAAQKAKGQSKSPESVLEEVGEATSLPPAEQAPPPETAIPTVTKTQTSVDSPDNKAAPPEPQPPAKAEENLQTSESTIHEPLKRPESRTELPSSDDQKSNISENIPETASPEATPELDDDCSPPPLPDSEPPQKTSPVDIHEFLFLTKEGKPLAPPRKGGTPGKRKAPAPPKIGLGSSVETTAQVHQYDDVVAGLIGLPNIKLHANFASKNASKDSGERSSFKKQDAPDSVEVDSLEASSLHEDAAPIEDNNSDVSGDSLEAGKDDQGPKRKASSLGDLTRLEEENSKHSPTLLERTMSLDFQQQGVPEDNLGQQKKILKPPNFDTKDTNEEDGFTGDGMQGGLKKWDFKTGWEQLHGSERSGTSVRENADPFSGVWSVSGQKKIEHNSGKTNGSFDTQKDSDVATGERQKITPDLELDLDLDDTSSDHTPHKSSSTSSASSDGEDKTVTSTPARKVIEVDSFLKEELLKDDKMHEEKRDPFLSRTSFTPSVDIPVIPPLTRNLEMHQLRTRQSPPPLTAPQKEVIELTENDLDNVMMSHKQFLLKQAKITGVYTPLNPDPASSIEFEPWSYVDNSGQSSNNVSLRNETVNGNGNESSRSHYKTALDMTLDLSTGGKDVTRKLTGTDYTVHSSEGGFAKTLIISTPDTPSEGQILLSPGSVSPPPQLQPPCD